MPILLPPDFSKYDAVACDKLIDQAYAQFTQAKNPQPGVPPWIIQDGYTDHGFVFRYRARASVTFRVCGFEE